MSPGLGGRRVLVVGAGGFIGRHVVSGLVAAQAKVTALDLAAPKRIPNGVVEWVTGNVSDESVVAAASAGQDAVVYLASNSLPASANHDLAEEINSHVRATVKAAEICEASGVDLFLFASSGGTVYGLEADEPLVEDSPTRPRNAYGVSKLAIEHYLRLIGVLRHMKTVSLRIANPYGEGQRSHRSQGVVAAAMQHSIEGTAMPIWGDGSVVRDFVYVGDVAEAFVAACGYEGPSTVINIGSGAGVTLLDIIRLVETATGRPIRLDFEPDRPIDVRRNVLDIRRAARHLSWTPKVSLESGIAATAGWWLRRLPAD